MWTCKNVCQQEVFQHQNMSLSENLVPTGHNFNMMIYYQNIFITHGQTRPIVISSWLVIWYNFQDCNKSLSSRNFCSSLLLNRITHYIDITIICFFKSTLSHHFPPSLGDKSSIFRATYSPPLPSTAPGRTGPATWPPSRGPLAARASWAVLRPLVPWDEWLWSSEWKSWGLNGPIARLDCKSKNGVVFLLIDRRCFEFDNFLLNSNYVAFPTLGPLARCKPPHSCCSLPENQYGQLYPSLIDPLFWNATSSKIKTIPGLA